MGKPTLAKITWGLYTTRVNLDGSCPYCGKKMSGMPGDYKEWHYKQEHTEGNDLANNNPDTTTQPLKSAQGHVKSNGRKV